MYFDDNFEPSDAVDEDEMASMDIILSIVYVLLAGCFVAPPTEFVSAGLTVQNLLGPYLGSENMNFIYYHIRRTTCTAVIHSLLPLGYYIMMGCMQPHLNLFPPWNASPKWQMAFIAVVTLPIVVGAMVYYWSRKGWGNHPISRRLSHLATANSNWASVASSINVEFRRVDKFMTGIPGRRMYITDSWVLKTSAYFVHAAHQGDVILTLDRADHHDFTPESNVGVQYLNIKVQSLNPKVQPFFIRLNALEYGDLREKLSSPVRNARNLLIQQSLSERFLDAFREQLANNPVFIVPENMEVDSCVGCMVKTADVKLQKHCDALEEGECRQCYCRPMWCQDCMGKWFASRQPQDDPSSWMSGRSPCPTCRATFCMLDVCLIT